MSSFREIIAKRVSLDGSVSSDTGRSILSAADGAAVRTVIDAAAGAHTHVMADISNVSISGSAPFPAHDVALTYSYSTSAWVARTIGLVGVGNIPLGGWPSGSLGAALADKAGTASPVFTGVVTVAAGTGTAGLYLPSVVFTGDPNTGIQQIGGSDTFSIVTGGHERLQIGSNGNIGITTASTATSKFAIGGNISGTGTNFISLAAGTAQSAVTQLWAYYTSPGVASDCAITNLIHYGAQQGTISGTVATQVGFYAVSTLTSGTNNFGFRGDLTSGAGRWNFYANGNANNYFAGNVGIGSGRTSPTSALDVNGVITVIAGSPEAPALTFTGDADTGIYRAGVNSLAFSTDGKERIRIGPDGEVGIGIAGSSTIGLRIRHDTNANNIVGTVLNVQMPANALTSYGYWTAPSLLAENTAYTSHIHYIANPIPAPPSGSSITGIEAGFQFGNTTQQHAVRAFVSALNSLTGYERYAIYCVGSAPSIFNGVVYFAAGSAALPSIAISSDTNTGLFAPSADNLAIATDGTERLRVDSSGKILVGTTTSRTAGPAIHPVFQFEGTNAGSASFQCIAGSAQAAVSPQIVLARHRGVVGASNLVQDGDTLAIIRFNGGDDTDCISTAAQIECRVDGTPGSNDMPGRLMFSTTSDGAATATERMRIKSNGVVRFIPLSADPASAEEGDMYFNSTSKKLKVYNGTSWVDLH